MRLLARPLLLLILTALLQSVSTFAQKGPMRGSLIEDRAARKLLEAGDARLDADEKEKALEIWQSVLERYPRSKVRFAAHMRIGNHLLTEKGSYDQARKHFEAAASEENSDDGMRAEATLKQGSCFFEAQLYGKCFTIMRRVIEDFPTSPEVNRAYYYIGLGHFKQAHYSRAIASLEKVGTALTKDDKNIEKVEAGKRLFVKIEDADLAILDSNESVEVVCTSKRGDSEKLVCRPVGRNVRLVLGSLPTRLGKVKKDNGLLEVCGGDVIEVHYVDRHTADKEFNKKRLKTVIVVGSAKVAIMDGSFKDTLRGAVLGKAVNLQVIEGDGDVTDGSDAITAKVQILRKKTPEEIESEIADLVAKGEIAAIPEGSDPLKAIAAEGEDGPKIDPFKIVDSLSTKLEEAVIEKPRSALAEIQAPDGAGTSEEAEDEPEETGAQADQNASLPVELAEDEEIDDSIHSGVFRGIVVLENSEEVKQDDKLQGLSGDLVRISYQDKLNITAEELTPKADAKCIEGNVGGVRVTKTRIDDEELRLQTELKTASALTEIGNHYKEFGLEDKSKIKYQEALAVAEETAQSARKLGGRILEESYVGLWKIYFAMGNLGAATAMSRRVQSEFPESAFVDDAILQQANIAREQGDLKSAIALYKGLTTIKNSELRGEGQFGIAECYEQMALDAGSTQAEGYFEQAFRAYRAVFEQYPESGRVGDSVAKMANFYYRKKDYRRAIDVFENVLSDHPDANFLDVILFNYGRCLYRIDKKADARRQFDQLIEDFPDSTLATEAKRISDALAKAGY